MRRLSFLLLLFALSAAPAYAASDLNDLAVAQSSSTVTVPDKLDDAALEQWTGKMQNYLKALNGVQNVRTLVANYLNWAKETGPTGKETSPSGISDATSYVKSFETLAGENDKISLKLPSMDQALREMADFGKELGVVTAEAHSYYRRKDYLEDGMAKGKELHAKIMAASGKLFAAADRLNAMVDKANPALQRQSLNQIERKYGKKYQWQHKNIMITARELVDTAPDSAANPLNKEAFDAALKNFMAAVKDFEDYYSATGEDALRKEAMLGFKPSSFDSFIASARELAANTDFGKSSAYKYQNCLKNFVRDFNSLVNNSNRTRFYVNK